MIDTLRCALENMSIGARGVLATRLPVTAWRDGVAITSGQVDRYRWAWETANAAVLSTTGLSTAVLSTMVLSTTGPLIAVLGDSAAQGIGASDPFNGWVGQVKDGLESRDEERWRVLNFSVSGARAADVLDQQLPRLWRLDHPVDLVVCAVGGNDMYRSTSWQIRDRFTRLVGSLPAPGRLGEGSRTVITTLPQGLGRRRAGIANDIVRTEAPKRGIEVADLWATTGPPWQGKYAADFFHPNDVGYGYWAQAILPVLRPDP